MSMMRTLLFIFLLIPAVLQAQGINPIISGDLPDAAAGEAENYGIESVLEYNEDAGVFIEFGFSTLMVQRITWQSLSLKAEVYRMQSAEAAFGAWSVSVPRCLQRDSVIPFDCSSLYQYQCAYGNFYISITCETGSEKARLLCIPVAQAIMKNNPQELFMLPEPFNRPQLKKARQTLVFTGGPVGMQNVLIPWQDLFFGVEAGTYSIILPHDGYDIYFARIRFATPDSRMRFFGLAGLLDNGVPVPNTNTNDGLYREYRDIDGQTIYFLQSQEPWPIDAVIAP
jgi:hypothetical protein